MVFLRERYVVVAANETLKNWEVVDRGGGYDVLRRRVALQCLLILVQHQL